jgi:hypothetical protein
MLRARNEKVGEATLDDVLRHMSDVKRELREGVQAGRRAEA